jgi:hypothetical protein
MTYRTTPGLAQSVFIIRIQVLSTNRVVFRLEKEEEEYLKKFKDEDSHGTFVAYVFFFFFHILTR